MDFSPGGLFAGLVVSGIGTGLVIYGRKQRRAPQLIGGLLLIVCPLVARGPWEQYAMGGGILGALWLALRFGM